MSGKISITVFSSVLAGLFSLNIFFLAGLNSKVDKLDTKIFTHMTNHDIHVPREYTVPKSEFELYKVLQKESIDFIKESLKRIENKVENGSK